MSNLFDIFVDSAANLTDKMVTDTGINVIPFSYTIDCEQKLCYEKGVPFTNTAKAFYEKLAGGADIKTSLVCEQDVIEAVTPSLEQGRDVLLITITESLSGTHAQALKAQKTLEEKFPDRKVYIVDSANASLGEGLLAVNAAKLRDMGENAETCAKWVKENAYRMNSYVTVNELKYLRKSGRVSTITAIAGTILNIKPMLKADGNKPAKLSVYAKERGRRKSLEAIAKAFAENVIEPENQTVAITHCNCEEDALKLAEMIRERGARDIVIEYYDLCTGAHVGPGTVALFFMGKDRLVPAATEAQSKAKAATQKF